MQTLTSNWRTMADGGVPPGDDEHWATLREVTMHNFRATLRPILLFLKKFITNKRSPNNNLIHWIKIDHVLL